MAVCATGLALLSALVAAVGPARGEYATYEWPPPALPSPAPTRGWYAPLPLLNRVPSSIVVRLPCALAPSLGTGPSATVVATARRPERTDGLRVALRGGFLAIGVGSSEIARAPWPESCPLRLEVRAGEVRLPGKTIELEAATLAHMPIVTGLFTSLDLRAGEAPRVVVRTRDYATSPTARQMVAAAAAVLLALFAMFLLVRERTRRPHQVRHGLASAWRARDPIDAVVVGVLLVWWVVAPAYTDDGWFATENRVFGDLGAASFYYDNWGVIRPVGYWLEWLGQWTIGATSDLVFMRLPILVVLFGCWALARSCLRLVLGEPPTRRALWILAGAFLVGGTAWSMTLRPEPVVALLGVVCLAAMVSYTISPRISRLAIALIATVLAVTAHPTGIVVLAPLLAGTPDLIRSLRRGRKESLGAFVAMLLAAVALALVLFSFDSDLAHRISDSHTIRTAEQQQASFWSEYLRYTRFDYLGGGTVLRRLSVALMFLSVVAAFTRRRSARTGISLLPAWSVGIGLALLAFVPSKWPWHFGALIAVAAVATAAETERLINERAAVLRHARLIAALIVISGLVLVAWSAPGSTGSALDLQRTTWREGFNGETWLLVWLVIPSAAMLIGCLISLRRGRRPPALLPSTVAWWLICVSFGAVAVTSLVLAVDTAKVSWSPARQNLEALTARRSCGLAGEMSAGSALVEQISDPAVTTLVHPSVGAYFPCVSIPRIGDGLAEIPGVFVLHSIWPLLVKPNPFAAASDLYRFRRIAQGPQNVRVYRVQTDVPGFRRADAITESSDGR